MERVKKRGKSQWMGKLKQKINKDQIKMVTNVKRKERSKDCDN